MGGVARRATALTEVRRKRQDLPVLSVETGNELKQSDNLDEPVNRWMLAALDELGTDVVNTTAGDLRRLNRLAETGRLPGEVRAQYVATMLASGEAPRFPVKPFVVKSIRSAGGGDEVRVGVMALSSGAEAGSQEPAPDENLKRILPEIDAQSDLVVLLSRLPDAELMRLANRFPAIDVIINGSSAGEGRELPKTGNTVIIESAHKGIALGILELEWDPKGHITKSKNQLYPLPPMIPDSPRLDAVVQQARMESARAQEEVARKSPAVTTPSVYAGASACKNCHEKAFKAWQGSRHARAMEKLKQASQFDSNCLPCHVTGYQATGGFVNVLRTPALVNVQCEACHGAALAHSGKPQTIHPGTGILHQMRRQVTRSFCLRCHTQENSPSFNFDVYWPKIAH